MSFVGCEIVFALVAKLLHDCCKLVEVVEVGAGFEPCVGEKELVASVNFFSAAIVKSTVKGFKCRLLCFW